jgi:hypothetical protein
VSAALNLKGQGSKTRLGAQLRQRWQPPNKCRQAPRVSLPSRKLGSLD